MTPRRKLRTVSGLRCSNSICSWGSVGLVFRVESYTIANRNHGGHLGDRTDLMGYFWVFGMLFEVFYVYVSVDIGMLGSV